MHTICVAITLDGNLAEDIKSSIESHELKGWQFVTACVTFSTLLLFFSTAL